LSWNPRDNWRRPREGRESAALGWSCAAELGWAPGKDGDHGNQQALQRQLCPGAAPLPSTAGLRALPAGSEGRGARQRVVKGSVGWEDVESSVAGNSSEPMIW